MQNLVVQYQKKYNIWVPIRDQSEQPVQKQEEFNLKYIAIYDDKLNIYFDKKVGDDAIQLARRVMYSDISQQCNNNDKICTIKEFQKLKTNFKIIDSVQSKMDQNVARQCLILPIIDSSNRQPQESMIYICETDLNKVRELYQFRDKLSSLITKYQLLMNLDIYNAANSVVRKQDLIKTVDSDNQLNTIMLRLFGNSLQIFKDSQNLNSLVYKIQVKDINQDKKAQTVNEAINLGYIDNTWNQNIKPKPINQCCFYLPLNGLLKQLYYCIHYDSPEQFDFNDCTIQTKTWVKEINTIVNYNQQIANYKKIMIMDEEIIDCEQTKEVKIFIDKIESLAKFQDQTCQDLSTFLPTWNSQNCHQDKEADILSYIQELTIENKKLSQSLQVCLKRGIIDLGKSWDNKKTSFLQQSLQIENKLNNKNKLKQNNKQNNNNKLNNNNMLKSRFRQKIKETIQQKQQQQEQQQKNVFQSKQIGGQNLFSVKLEDNKKENNEKVEDKMNIQQEKQYYSPTQKGALFDNFYFNMKEGDIDNSYETMENEYSFLGLKQKASKKKELNKKMKDDEDTQESVLKNTQESNEKDTQKSESQENDKDKKDELDPEKKQFLEYRIKSIQKKLQHIDGDPNKLQFKFDQDFDLRNQRSTNEVFLNYLNSVSQQAKKINQLVVDNDQRNYEELTEQTEQTDKKK